jgi:DNA-binding transcriptional regulator YiaG
VYRVTSKTAEIDGALDLASVVERVRRTRLPDTPSRRAIRETAGVTIREMAILVGVSPMSVCRWERGTTPAPGRAAKYREVLDALKEAA